MTVSINGTTTTDLTRDPLAPRGPLALEIKMDALRQLGMKELHNFREVMQVIRQVLDGFTCQPRFSNVHDTALNGAGDLLEDIVELIGGYEQAAVNVAKAARPADSDAVEWRNWTVLGYEADMADNLADFAARATEAAQDAGKAKFREDHHRLAA